MPRQESGVSKSTIYGTSPADSLQSVSLNGSPTFTTRGIIDPSSALARQMGNGDGHDISGTSGQIRDGANSFSQHSLVTRPNYRARDSGCCSGCVNSCCSPTMETAIYKITRYDRDDTPLSKIVWIYSIAFLMSFIWIYIAFITIGIVQHGWFGLVQANPTAPALDNFVAAVYSFNLFGTAIAAANVPNSQGWALTMICGFVFCCKEWTNIQSTPESITFLQTMLLISNLVGLFLSYESYHGGRSLCCCGKSLSRSVSGNSSLNEHLTGERRLFAATRLRKRRDDKGNKMFLEMMRRKYFFVVR